MAVVSDGSRRECHRQNPCQPASRPLQRRDSAVAVTSILGGQLGDGPSECLFVFARSGSENSPVFYDEVLRCLFMETVSPIRKTCRPFPITIHSSMRCMR